MNLSQSQDAGISMDSSEQTYLLGVLSNRWGSCLPTNQYGSFLEQELRSRKWILLCGHLGLPAPLPLWQILRQSTQQGWSSRSGSWNPKKGPFPTWFIISSWVCVLGTPSMTADAGQQLGHCPDMRLLQFRPSCGL